MTQPPETPQQAADRAEAAARRAEQAAARSEQEADRAEAVVDAPAEEPEESSPPPADGAPCSQLSERVTHRGVEYECHYGNGGDGVPYRWRVAEPMREPTRGNVGPESAERDGDRESDSREN